MFGVLIQHLLTAHIDANRFEPINIFRLRFFPWCPRSGQLGIQAGTPAATTRAGGFPIPPLHRRASHPDDHAVPRCPAACFRHQGRKTVSWSVTATGREASAEAALCASDPGGVRLPSDAVVRMQSNKWPLLFPPHRRPAGRRLVLRNGRRAYTLHLYVNTAPRETLHGS